MDEAERCSNLAYLYQANLIAYGKPAELKQLPQVTPQGTRRWELEIADPTRYMTKVRDIPAVLDATLFGQTIHLLARDDPVRRITRRGNRVRRSVATDRADPGRRLRDVHPGGGSGLDGVAGRAADVGRGARSPSAAPAAGRPSDGRAPDRGDEGIGRPSRRGTRVARPPARARRAAWARRRPMVFSPC